MSLTRLAAASAAVRVESDGSVGLPALSHASRARVALSFASRRSWRSARAWFLAAYSRSRKSAVMVVIYSVSFTTGLGWKLASSSANRNEPSIPGR